MAPSHHLNQRWLIFNWPSKINFQENGIKIQPFYSRKCISKCVQNGGHIIQALIYQIDDLVQNCSISSANALEILQSCTKPSKCEYTLEYVRLR